MKNRKWEEILRRVKIFNFDKFQLGKAKWNLSVKKNISIKKHHGRDHINN
jgi:hypothetical protein